MKKSGFLLAAFLLLSIITVRAQVFSQGSNVISAGIGLGSSIADYTFGSVSPAIDLKYERGLWKAGPGVVSLGAYVGYKAYKYSSDGVTEKWDYTIIGVRGAWHYTGLKVEHLDVYGGIMLSYDNLHYSIDEDGTNYGGSVGNYGSAVAVTPFVGARYYFAGHLGGEAELGYGVSYLHLGLCFTF